MELRHAVIVDCMYALGPGVQVGVVGLDFYAAVLERFEACGGCLEPGETTGAELGLVEDVVQAVE